MTDTPLFEINEKLKEDLVNFFGSHKAKTIYRKNGNFLNPEPYLETEIYWDVKNFKELQEDIMEELSDMLHEAKEKIAELGGQMTSPSFEMFTGSPVLVWAVFATKSKGFFLETD